jgi:hypothetical protein
MLYNEASEGLLPVAFTAAMTITVLWRYCETVGRQRLETPTGTTFIQGYFVWSRFYATSLGKQQRQLTSSRKKQQISAAAAGRR